MKILELKNCTVEGNFSRDESLHIFPSFLIRLKEGTLNQRFDFKLVLIPARK